MLGGVVLFNHINKDFPHEVTTFMLLYAMGLQNSFVTKISNASVRTTHLTGLFTDLGIELSQLFYLKRNNYFQQEQKIKNSIKLRLSIVIFFFLGGFFAGFSYIEIGLGFKTLLFAIVILLSGLYYDDLRFLKEALARIPADPEEEEAALNRAICESVMATEGLPPAHSTWRDRHV